MVIWSGWGGIVGALIVFGCLLGTQQAVDGAKGKGYYKAHGWPKTVALVTAGVAVWFLGNAVNRPRRRSTDDGRMMVEESGGHTLFFIPVQYWGYLLVAGGIGFLFL